MRKVINLLEKELKLHERSREKSIESYGNRDISHTTHTEHMINLNCLILQFKRAIKKLKNN